MPISDPIGDMLTRMRNAQHARSESCKVPLSKITMGICELLKREDYLQDVSVEGEGAHKNIRVTFVPGKIMELKRKSTPGRRLYVKAAEVKPHLSGFGMSIISTSAGLLTDNEARQKKMGGELLCTIAA